MAYATANSTNTSLLSNDLGEPYLRHRSNAMSNGIIDQHVGDTTERLHLSAFNAAFDELGLRWHWDDKTYHELRHHSCEKERVRIYLQTHQSHLLTAYDASFLVEAIYAVKARRYEAMVNGGMQAVPDVDWAAVQRFRRDI
jgi:hypothetical protein